MSDVDATLKELEYIAADSQLVAYGSRTQCALLRAVGTIRRLQGQLMVADADLMLARIREDISK